MRYHLGSLAKHPQRLQATGYRCGSSDWQARHLEARAQLEQFEQTEKGIDRQFLKLEAEMLQADSRAKAGALAAQIKTDIKRANADLQTLHQERVKLLEQRLVREREDLEASLQQLEFTEQTLHRGIEAEQEQTSRRAERLKVLLLERQVWQVSRFRVISTDHKM